MLVYTSLLTIKCLYVRVIPAKICSLNFKGFLMRKIAKLIILIVVLSLGSFVWAQAETSDTSKAQSNTDWLWGEVVSVDVNASSLLVSYLDFNLDEEKQIVIKIDAQTVLEGAKSVAEISAGDIVSIDFVKENETTNLGKKVLVEKPDSVDLIAKSESKADEAKTVAP